MKSVLLVFLGGGLGSVMRYLLSKWINSFSNHPFPFGTLVVNILACLILGFIIGLADYKQIISPSTRLFWTVGVCGGFSTFSTFSNETLYLIQNGLTVTLALYISLSLLLCVGATFGGIYLSGRM
jgi:CrcB protein